MKQYLCEKFHKIEIELTDCQCEQLLKYYEMLVETNKVMNLTAITEFEEVVQKHFIDSAVLFHVYQLPQTGKMLDVGTGAGFPGLVLKILYPELSVTLLDSLAKRINFLKNVGSELGLEKIEYLHGRAEDYAHNPAHREKYDFVVSRAVANLSTLSEYCLPYVKVGGSFVSYKAKDCEEEVAAAAKAIQKLGGAAALKKEYDLPGGEITRAFILIEKRSQTSGKYPRKAGLPGKEPLC